MNSATMKAQFGKSFRKAREAKNLSRAALAVRLGISPKTIQSWEMGRTFIENLSLIPAIEKELAVVFTDLLNEAQGRPAAIAAEAPAAYGSTAVATAPATEERIATGPQRPAFLVAEHEENPGEFENYYISVPLIRAASANKPVNELQGRDLQRNVLFPDDWCPRGRILVAYTMQDSALSPTVPRGAIVLVDRRLTSPERLDGKLAALWTEEKGLRIRRLQCADDGSVEGLPEDERKRGFVKLEPARGDVILGRVLGYNAPVA